MLHFNDRSIQLHQSKTDKSHTYFEKPALRFPGKGTRVEGSALVLAALAHDPEDTEAAVLTAARDGSQGRTSTIRRVYLRFPVTTGDKTTPAHGAKGITHSSSPRRIQSNCIKKWTLVNSR